MSLVRPWSLQTCVASRPISKTTYGLREAIVLPPPRASTYSTCHVLGKNSAYRYRRRIGAKVHILLSMNLLSLSNISFVCYSKR